MSVDTETIEQVIIISNRQSPGDIIALTAAVRDLILSGFKCRILADTSCSALWENNPFAACATDAETLNADRVKRLAAEYPAIHRSNSRPRHFIEAFHEDISRKLGVPLPITAFKGDAHLSTNEKQWPLDFALQLPRHYWIVVAGGKYDFTAKWWNPAYAQAVVDHFRGKITFVQCGEAGHWHPPLDGVLNLVGKTDIRQFIRIMYHADGVVCPVTFAMHLAAAVPVPPDKPFKLRPCVVVAGGREPVHWEAYPGHQFLHTVGMLDCCATGGCWRSRCQLVGDGDEKDRVNVCSRPVQVSEKLRVPQCMQMITPGDVITAIEKYLAGWEERAADATGGSPPAVRVHGERRAAGASVEPPIASQLDDRQLVAAVQTVPRPSTSVSLNGGDRLAAVRPILERIPSAWRGLETFVQGLIASRQPKVIVDLGVDCGYSTIAMAAAGTGTVYGIDSFQGDAFVGARDTEAVCRQNVLETGLSNVELIKGRFSEVSRGWALPVDLLHIDGSHDYGSVKDDFLSWQPHLADDAIVLFHDTTSYPDGPGRLFRELPFAKYEIEEHHGLGVAFISTQAHASVPSWTPAGSSDAWDGAVSVGIPDRLYPSRPLRMGLVIGTFGSVPYIHLQLEARKRFCPNVAMLVHDDCSKCGSELRRLCDSYGASFESNDSRQPFFIGDVTAFLGGLVWAKRRQLDLLLKLSRRWLFVVDWASDLARLAQESQYATFSNITTTYGFGFRTECTAMSVRQWSSELFQNAACNAIDLRREIFVENYIHQFALFFEKSNCRIANKWREKHPVSMDRSGYATWDLMGIDRHTKEATRLWHNSNPPAEYAQLARAWGLPYDLNDFIDPNQGEGLSTQH